jgi:hypothetical protein
MSAIVHSLSLAEARSRLEAALNRDKRAKVTMHRLESALVRKATITLTAAGFGAMTRHKVPNAVKGFPWKLGVWAGATLVEALTDGFVQQMAGAVGDTTLGVYTHDAVAQGTLIAGDGGEI